MSAEEAKAIVDRRFSAFAAIALGAERAETASMDNIKRDVVTVMLEGRREVSLCEMGELIRGRGITKADLVDDGIPCLRYGEIYTTYESTTKELKSRVSDKTASKSTRLRYGDIIFAASGETQEEIGKALAWLGVSEAVVGGDTIVLRGHGQDPTYMAACIERRSGGPPETPLGQGPVSGTYPCIGHSESHSPSALTAQTAEVRENVADMG